MGLRDSYRNSGGIQGFAGAAAIWEKFMASAKARRILGEQSPFAMAIIKGPPALLAESFSHQLSYPMASVRLLPSFP